MSLILSYFKNYTGNAKVMSNNSFSHIIKTINQSCFDGTNFNLKKTDLDEVPHTTNNYVDTANMVFFYILPFDNSSHLYYNINSQNNKEKSGSIKRERLEKKLRVAPMKHFITCSVPLDLIGEVIWSESR